MKKGLTFAALMAAMMHGKSLDHTPTALTAAQLNIPNRKFTGFRNKNVKHQQWKAKRRAGNHR